MKLYEKLKLARVEEGISTYELSELTGIPQSTISKMENGKRKIEVEEIKILANALNKTVSYFFDENRNCDDKEDKDIDIRIIERARNKMPIKDKEKMMNILKLSFEEYFNEDDEEDDDI